MPKLFDKSEVQALMTIPSIDLSGCDKPEIDYAVKNLFDRKLKLMGFRRQCNLKLYITVHVKLDW